MKQQVLTFRHFDDCTLEEQDFSLPAGYEKIQTLYSMISPGTELFCIRQAIKSGSTVQPGYILTGMDQKGRNCFLFPSLSQSSACHCNIRAVAPDSLLMPLPEGFPLEYAGFLRMINIGLHPFNQLPRLPKKVAVIGLGPVGNLAAQSARLLGCEVTGVDPSANRRKIANDCQIHTTLCPEELGEQHQAFDFVIDTVASSSTLLTSAQILQDGGECSMVGIIKDGDLKASELLQKIWAHKLVFRSGWEMLHPIKKQSDQPPHSTQDNLVRAIQWITEGGYILKPLLSGIVPAQIPQIKQAYQLLKDQPDEHMCFAIQWQ